MAPLFMVSGQTRQIEAAGGIGADRQSNGGQLFLGLRILPVPTVQGKVTAIGRFVDNNGIGSVGADIALMAEIGAL